MLIPTLGPGGLAGVGRSHVCLYLIFAEISVAPSLSCISVSNLTAQHASPHVEFEDGSTEITGKLTRRAGEVCYKLQG